jgi:protease I
MHTITVHEQEIKARDLSGKTIAILATDGFEQSELLEPMQALTEMGARVEVIAPSETMEEGQIKAWDHTDWGQSVEVELSVEQADAATYDALVLPGGVMNPDKLRLDAPSLDFVRAFFKAGKPVAAICHGPQVLIEAQVVERRRMTSYPSVKTDLENAGAIWEDREVVVDQGLVTSRSPDDIPAFVDKIAEEVLEGIHRGQHA